MIDYLEIDKPRIALKKGTKISYQDKVIYESENDVIDPVEYGNNDLIVVNYQDEPILKFWSVIKDGIIELKEENVLEVYQENIGTIIRFIGNAEKYNPGSIEYYRGVKVLEVGAGSGYNMAIISKLVEYIVSIELIENLANIARQTINKLIEAKVVTDNNMLVIHGDGYDGYRKLERYDKIIVTAAPNDEVPPRGNQLKVGGILISPLHDTKIGKEHIVRIDRLSEEMTLRPQT